jgi:hypothetical protein
MKLVAYVLALAFLVVAAIYFIYPANSLPSFFPGFDPTLARIHLKHGLAAGGVAVILFLLGWFIGRSRD